MADFGHCRKLEYTATANLNLRRSLTSDAVAKSDSSYTFTSLKKNNLPEEDSISISLL